MKKERPLWKKILGCLKAVVFIVVMTLFLVKAVQYVSHKTDPVNHNEASVDFGKYNATYFALGKVFDFANVVGKKSGDFCLDYLIPFADRFMMSDSKEVLDNSDILQIKGAEYTLDKAKEATVYNGRKVSVSGKIDYVSDYYTELALDVNEDFSGEDVVTRIVALDHTLARGYTDLKPNDCVSVEGYFLLDPGDFSSPDVTEAYILARDIEKADYAALDGDPENAYIYQEASPCKTVEEDGFTVKITGVSVDAASKRAVVRYNLFLIGQDNLYVNIFAVKGNLGGDGGTELYRGTDTASYFEIKEEGLYTEQIESGKNNITIIICGYNDQPSDEQSAAPDPAADRYMKIDIPKELWTIYTDEN